MIDAEKVNRQKERIISTIRLRGPSLPVQIAKVLEVSPLFASAFLSELKAENKLRVSNLRVGSSPLYYLAGQENLLENFTKYLNGREREAFELLKREKVLEDEKQAPVVRVALRAIKDFANSVRVRIDGESKLFWKHFGVDDSEIGEIISRDVVGRSVERREEVKRESVPSHPRSVSQVDNSPTHPPDKILVGSPVHSANVSPSSTAHPKLIEKQDRVESKLEGKAVAKSVVKKPKVVETEFSRNVKDYLNGKDVEILEILGERKREFEGRVRIDTLFGKQEYYLIAKDKKSATDNDLAIAWQKSQVERLPALFMATGDLSRKGQEHLGNWRNLVKWEKLKF